MGLFDAVDDFGEVVESAILRDEEQRAGGAGLRVHGSEHEPLQSRKDDRPCTHRARLKSDVERALAEAFLTDGLTGRSDGDHLGVSRRVVQLLDHVPTAPDDDAVTNDNGPYGHLVGFERLFGFTKCVLHEALVGRGCVDLRCVEFALTAQVGRVDLR